jgi:uncharacterized domain HDIG
MGENMDTRKKHREAVIGYVTHDVNDKFGRLLLAEGTPVTKSLVQKLEDRRIRFHMTKEPLGGLVSSRPLNPGFRESPFSVPDKLDEKFERLDTKQVWNAIKYLKSILSNVEEDFFMSNLIKAFSQRQRATYSHSINVAILSIAIAEKLNMNHKDLQDIAVGSILHDVGEMFLPPAVLKGTSRMGDSNEIIFQQHPRIGADVLIADKLPPGIYLIAQQHHERYSGGGYPSGAKEGEIHMNACIVSVADVFDRLTTSFYQGNVLTPEEAIERVSLDKGIGFHPDVADKFIELFKTTDNC